MLQELAIISAKQLAISKQVYPLDVTRNLHLAAFAVTQTLV